MKVSRHPCSHTLPGPVPSHPTTASFYTFVVAVPVGMLFPEDRPLRTPQAPSFLPPSSFHELSLLPDT